jgi:serine protease Do
MHRMVRKAALPAALVLGVGAAATAMDAMQSPIPAVGAQSAAPVDPIPAGAASLSTAFRAASKAALGAVVYIEVEASPRAVRQQLPEELRGTPFEQFFGAPRGQPMPSRGSGSGFIISSDGYVLTNNHVVENANRVTVTLTDKREFEAEVVGRDPNTDVAVLRIDGKGFPVARLGDSEALEIGDWVLALGYPLSLGETVTAGIVSAKGKSIGIMRQNEDATAPLEHFIQTDAAINPGNSGGPLINLNGEVVGINSAIASPTGTYSGYGFAVPVQLAKRVADDLIRYGAVHRPRLGVAIDDVHPADVEVYRLPSANGAVVKTDPEGPAKEAGVRLGDVIVAVNGGPIEDTSDLMESIALLQPGDRVTLDLIRYGKRERVTVKLGAFETAPVARNDASGDERDAVARLGFAARELTPSIAQQLGFEGSGGLVVTDVDRMGPAPAGLRGLRLRSINGQDVASVEELRKVAASVAPGATVSVLAELPTGERTIVNYRLRG